MTAPGHAGTYLGSGLIIDAPTTGQVVHIGQLQLHWTRPRQTWDGAVPVGSQRSPPGLKLRIEREEYGIRYRLAVLYKGVPIPRKDAVEGVTVRLQLLVVSPYAVGD